MTGVLKSYDPSNGQLVGEVPMPAIETIPAVVEKAKQAAVAWGNQSIAERVQIIQKAFAQLEPEAEELATLLSREMGKDIRRSSGEVQGCIYSAAPIASSAEKALQPQRSGRSTTEYMPLGVVAVISPWNYPLGMANNLIIPALVAGNSVVFKPSEETPLVAQAYVDLLNQVLPENALQIIHGTGEQGRALVESDVNMIAFTGSQRTGKDIMQRAAGSLKRLVMELGGNDPMIVMADADVTSAARFAVASSFENAGQMCIATERIYVDEKIADQFEHRVVELAKQYKVGPWNESVNIGPIINEKQHRLIVEHIKDAIDKGATPLLGGSDQPERYIQPTVLSGMTPEMRIEKEETFGPVVCISRFSDIDDAITRANDSAYGLGAVVFGRQGVKSVARQMQAGMIGINQGVGGMGDSPWVGAKQSGFGFHGSADGHKQFAQVRVINE